MGDEIANRQPRADVAAALAEPAFASLARAGAPIVVAEGEPARVVHANATALALFAVADCQELTVRLFASDEPGARRLAHLARVILPGAAARLERLSLRFDLLPETVTFLCRRTPGDDPLFVLAGLGLRVGQSRARPRGPAHPQASPARASAPPQEPTSAHEKPFSPPVPPSALDALRGDFERRRPGLAPARFLWRTDADNVVTEVTPPLAEIVGAGCADLVGRDLIAAAEALGLDPRQKLAAALRGRVTFSGVELDWPIEKAAASAPVTFGGLPAFGSDRAFEGWRGFGVIHLDRLHDAPPVVAPFGDKAPARITPDRAAPDQFAPDRAAPEYSGVVVPLRPLAQLRPAPPQEPGDDEPRPDEAKKPAPPRDGDEDSVLVSLAPHERSAFREIARTLGARGESAGGFGAPPETPREPAENKMLAMEARPAEAPDAEAKHAPAVAAGEANPLDALPIGLLVARGDKLVFANRPLLDWLGFADPAALERAGGLRAACAGGTLDFAPSERRALLLRSVSGEAFTVDAHSARAAWEGAPAEFHALIRPSAAALEQRISTLEAALRQRESEADDTRAVLETAADGFVVVDAEGVVLGLDKSAEALFGQGRGEIAGENFLHLFAPESHALALDCFSRLKATAEKCGCEATGRARQGGAIPLRLTFGRLGKTEHGKFCLVLRDMSQWPRAEGASEQARAEAERDSQAKTEFLATVSHEIRTPLNAILGFAEVIMDERFGPIGNARYKEYLKDIHASGSHVMSLVNDLLDLSKIESGKSELAFAAVDANRVVAECVSMIQPQANREKVITRLALAARLPAIFADERSLRQIVLNLLANAVRYNEPGGQVIVSTALGESGHAILRVKDTGIGMSEKDLQKAMEPFRQVDPGRGGGAGLGLPLTKALVEANHAGFAIRSSKGEGTLVEITFPLAPAVASAAGKAG